MKTDPIAECRVCTKPFMRMNTMQAVCGIRCSAKVGKLKRQAEKAADRAKRERLKSRGQWLKEAQAAVNTYVRLRDAKLPCVSCGRHHDGQWHAGHYLTTGARPELRFDLANIHKQCQPCNTHLHGNLVLYRAELIRRIGLAEVERLEGPQEPKKYTADDLRGIRDHYRLASRELKAKADLLGAAA